MKQMFDWFREQIEESSAVGFVNDGACFNYIPKILAENIINEAETKWEADCCEWKPIITHARRGHKNCQFAEDITDTWKFNFCPYCGKRIKISEVE